MQIFRSISLPLILLLQATAIGVCQEPQEIPLDNKISKRTYEISSLAFLNDTFYMASEKCKKLFLVTKDGGYIRKDTLKIDRKCVGIEGLAHYKGELFMTDENNGTLWSYSLSTNSIYELKTDRDDIVSKLTGETGMEGIAIDEDNGVFYIMQERDSENHGNSHLYIFSVVSSEDKHTLKYEREVLILQDDNMRYSDIYFDPIKNRLVCLRTKYGKYYIDSIPISALKDTIKACDFKEIKIKDSTKIKLSDTKNDNGYNTNLEGILLNDGTYYIVSDNLQTGKCFVNSTTNERALFLSIKP